MSFSTVLICLSSHGSSMVRSRMLLTSSCSSRTNPFCRAGLLRAEFEFEQERLERGGELRRAVAVIRDARLPGQRRLFGKIGALAQVRACRGFQNLPYDLAQPGRRRVRARLGSRGATGRRAGSIVVGNETVGVSAGSAGLFSAEEGSVHDSISACSLTPSSAGSEENFLRSVPVLRAFWQS